MFNADPRFLMAETYSLLHNNKELLELFDKGINNVNSADKAIELCLEYQKMVENA